MWWTTVPRAILVSVPFMLFPQAVPAQTGTTPAPTATVLPDNGPWTMERIERHFELHPELRSTKSSGYKPYMRLKWFDEQRMTDGRPPEPGARWNAWLATRDRQSRVQAGAMWFELGPTNFSGRIREIAFHPTDPNVIYAASASGGLWKTADAGASWFPLGDDLPPMSVGAIAVLPSDPDVVLIGTGEGLRWELYSPDGSGILKSTNGGTTWTTTGLSVSSLGHGVHVIEVNPITGTILAGATDGLWRSTDDGDTWTQIRVGGDYYDVKWKPGDADRVYACKGDDASGNNVKVSTNDGLTWSKAGTGQPSSFQIGPTRLAVTPADPSTIYAMFVTQPFEPSNLLGVYRSTDDGATWTAQNTTQDIVEAQGWWNLFLAASPTDADVVVGGGLHVWRSTNAGVAWSSIDYYNGYDWYSAVVHGDVHDAGYSPHTGDIWVTSDGGIWSTADTGVNWTERNNGLATYQFYDICVAQSDPNILFGGTQDQGTDRRTNATTTWSEGLFADGMVCEIHPTNPSIAYAEIQEGSHYRTTNGGSTWLWSDSGLTGTGNWVTPVAMDPGTPTELWTGTTAGIFRTTNSMVSWQNVAPHAATWISASPVDGNLVWTVAAVATYTTDNGATWIDAAPFGGSHGTATKILAHPTDPASALVTFSGYGTGLTRVALTTDLGATWTDVTGDLPSIPVNAIAVDDQATTNWFVGTDVGVWATTNSGTHWGPYQVGLPDAVVTDLQIRTASRKLVAGTYGRGAWEVDITPPLSTGAGITAASGPMNLMLDPPRPNPARGPVVLRFAARHEGTVSLDVFDVRGRRVSSVATLDRGDGFVRAVTWYPDDFGSGVYFAVLSAGDQRISRKLVLVP